MDCLDQTGSLSMEQEPKEISLTSFFALLLGKEQPAPLDWRMKYLCYLSFSTPAARSYMEIWLPAS